MSKFLVTGVAGFIGSEIATQLLKKGHQVIGIDSFNEILYKNHHRINRIQELIKNRNFDLMKENILKINLDEILKGVDIVINEAGLPGQIISWDKIEEYFESNAISAYRLFDFRQRNGVKCFIQASTSCVYGVNAIGIENQNLRPISPYGVSKLAGENLLFAVKNNNSGTKLIVMRYFSVYGPRQRPDMGIYKFIKCIMEDQPISIYGDGEQTRDFTFISDAAQASILAAEYGYDGEIYNVAGGMKISVNLLLEKLKIIANKEIKLNYVDKVLGDQENTDADTSKIRRHLNWAPEVTLDQGLMLQYNWQMQNRFNV